MEYQPTQIIITIAEHEGTVRITGQGNLVYQTTQSAKEQLAPLPGEASRYIFDMRQIEKIDSTGFGLILNLIKRIPREVKLTVVLTDPFIKELFMVTKVNFLVDMVSAIEES